VSPLQSAPTREAMESLTSTNEPPASQDIHLPTITSHTPTIQSDTDLKLNFDKMETGPDNLRDGRGITENIEAMQHKLESKLSRGGSTRSGILSKMDKAMNKLQFKLEDMMDRIQTKFEMKGTLFLNKMGEMMDKIGDKVVGATLNQKAEKTFQKLEEVSSSTPLNETHKVVQKRDSDDVVTIDQPLDVSDSITVSGEQEGGESNTYEELHSDEDFVASLDSAFEKTMVGDDGLGSDIQFDEVMRGSLISEGAERIDEDEAIPVHTDQALLDQLSRLMPQSVDPGSIDNAPSSSPTLEIYEIHQVVGNNLDLDRSPSTNKDILGQS